MLYCVDFINYNIARVTELFSAVEQVQPDKTVTSTYIYIYIM